MNWKDTAEQAQFRTEVRELIRTRLPERYREMAAAGGPGERTWEFDRKSEDATARDAAHAWHAALGERGWVAPALAEGVRRRRPHLDGAVHPQ